MLKVAYQDLEIYQGSTHEFELIIYEDDLEEQPADLTGFSVRGSIKKEYTSPVISANFDCYIGPITTLPEYEGVSGNHAITFKLSSAVTKTFIEHDYVYDLEIYQQDSNAEEIVYKILEGKIYINPSVTS